LDALERASGFLRNEIAQNVKMKQAPRLRFILDKGIENAARVEELLAQINKKG
jgi:ribosome-binding factor A